MGTSAQSDRLDAALAPSRRTLSKSDFIVARGCNAKLYFRKNGYPDKRDSNAYLELLAEGGYMVEALAKAFHPDGIGIDPPEGMERAYAETVEYLKRDSVTLFGATLLHNRRQARVDILRKSGNTVRLLEVKSVSFDGDEHRASVMDGGKGILRGKRKPFKILTPWEDKLADITFQTLILEKMRPDLEIKPYLVLVDTSKRAGVDDVPLLFELDPRPRYAGTREMLEHLDLLTEVDVSEEVAMLREEIERAAERFETMLDASLDDHLAIVNRSSICRDCEFRHPDDFQPNGFIDCWGPLAKSKPHVLDLYYVGSTRLPDKTPLIEGMIARGTTSLLDVPLDCFEIKPDSPGARGNRQRRQVEYTRDQKIYTAPELRREVARLERASADGSPLYFIDFETSRLALPYHKGMRPYGLVAFQWSCHTVSPIGDTPRHAQFLNTHDLWPNQQFVESLRAHLGDSGPVIVWTPYEASTLKELAPQLAEFGHDTRELIEWTDHLIAERIVDLHEWACKYYYNPGMGGRTSIKVVLDALWKSDDAMRQQFAQWTGRSGDGVDDPYKTLPKIEIAGSLQDVHEGTGAMRAYEEMMYGAGKRNQSIRDAWAKLLTQYCELDTLSMVLVLEHWRRITRM